MREIAFAILSFPVLMCACAGAHDRLEEALELAGDNRDQLEAVIEHYSQDEADSLKLRAARFLIENMPGHYSVAGEAVERQRRAVDSAYASAPAFIRQYAYGLPTREAGGWQEYERQEDVRTLSAGFLIETIDEAFEMLATCPWLEGIQFDDFCDFVLPYRKFDEPLVFDRAGRDSMWREMRDITLRYRNYRPAASDLKRLYRERDWDKTMKSFKGDCIEGTYMSALHQKQFAMPVTCDMVPAWSSYHGMHRWTVLVSPGEINETPRTTTMHVPNKVYRITYSHNPIPESDGGEIVPPFFRNPFYRDVTAKYTSTVNITVRPQVAGGRRPRNLYLAVFSAGEWTPVAWAEIEGGKALFRDMGVNAVYQAVYYDSYEQLPAGDPILVDKGGNMRTLTPDRDSVQSVTLTRKFPMKLLGVIRSTENVEKVAIEASDDRDFRTVHVMGRLDAWQTDRDQGWNVIEVADRTPYRYWRINKGGGRFEVGEIEFVDSAGDLLKGRTIQADEKGGSARTVYDAKYDPAFDGDPLKSVESRSWLGLDMGSPQSVARVRYVGRTDRNYIEPGHDYELLVCDGGRWRSLGQQTAVADSVTFGDVPCGGFYWIRNLTEGKEERPFTFFDGRVRWY